jgi:hypothetical protein
MKKTEPQNVTRKAASEEASGQGPRAIPTRKDDKAQVSLTCIHCIAKHCSESHRPGRQGSGDGVGWWGGDVSSSYINGTMH